MFYGLNSCPFIRRSGDGVNIGCLLALPMNLAEALENITEAIELCLEVPAERGLPLEVETRHVEVAL